jgi:hypothetical protein
MDDKLSRIEDMLTQLIQMQAANNAKIEEMMADIKEIKEGQERQDRILEMLSVKSIETDSYIRDFKRRL